MADKSRILVVDDEDALRSVLSNELTGAGYEVATAADGDEAMSTVQNKKFDLVLLDMKMPRVDGREVLQFIQTPSPSSQVIILSQFADLKMAVESTKLGAYEVLGKPYDIEQIEQTIQRAIDRKKLTIDNKLLQTELDR